MAGTIVNGKYAEVAVGLVDAPIAAPNPARTAVLVSNPGPNPVYVAFGKPAVAQRSFLIPPGGAPIRFSNDDYPGLLAGEIRAITTGAAGFLAVLITDLS